MTDHTWPWRRPQQQILSISVPDPNFPFLGGNFTRKVIGGIEAGPNAVLASQREGYHRNMKPWLGRDFKKLRQNIGKRVWLKCSVFFSKSAFTKALQELISDIQASDLIPGGAGVRAQACDLTGGLLDDFCIRENQIAINVLNAPSPATTSSLSIGETVSELDLNRFTSK